MASLTVPVVCNVDADLKDMLDLLARSEAILRTTAASPFTHPAIKYQIEKYMDRAERRRAINSIRIRCEK